jgi:hypothetical protein
VRVAFGLVAGQADRVAILDLQQQQPPAGVERAQIRRERAPAARSGRCAQVGRKRVPVDGVEEAAERLGAQLAHAKAQSGEAQRLVVGVLHHLADEGLDVVLERVLGGITSATRARRRQLVEHPVHTRRNHGVPRYSPPPRAQERSHLLPRPPPCGVAGSRLRGCAAPPTATHPLKAFTNSSEPPIFADLVLHK